MTQNIGQPVMTLAAFIGLSCAAFAQAPAPPPLATPNPHYISIPLEVAVNRPAEEAWKRVGRFCDIREWMNLPCIVSSGKEGELGAGPRRGTRSWPLAPRRSASNELITPRSVTTEISNAIVSELALMAETRKEFLET